MVFFMTIYRDIVFGEKQYEPEEIHSDCLAFTENLPSTLLNLFIAAWEISGKPTWE
jgi:hypothetical protein